MRLRQLDRLVYGSTSLVIVDPRENHGHDVVPVTVGRKRLQRFVKYEHSADGMFFTDIQWFTFMIYSFFAMTNHIKVPSK